MTILKKLLLQFSIIILSVSFTYTQGWYQQVSGTTSALNSVYFINENTGWTVGNGGVALKTTNGGVNWMTLNTGSGRNFYSIQFINLNTGFIGTGWNKVFRTTNSGSTWDTVTNGGGFLVFFINSTTGFSTGQSSGYGLWKTTNTGISWENLGLMPAIMGPVNDIFFLNESQGLTCGNHYAMSGQTYTPFIAKTTNGGSSWSERYTAPSSHYTGSSIYDLLFINNFGFAVGNESSSSFIPYFYKSTNTGENWVKSVLPQPMTSLKFIDSDNGWLCGTNGKIICTINGGTTWLEQASGVVNNLRQIFMINNNTGYIVGENGTILKTTNGGFTAIQQTGTYIPDNFSLSQNYPNPFNPVTQIKFDIPKSSLVNLIVFDVTGREVEVLANNQLGAGSYSIDWNASTNPSGVYFYKITAGDFIQTKKMVLIK